MTEKNVSNQILLRAADIYPAARLFRNNIGQAWQGKVVSKTAGHITLKNPRPIHAGLLPGSADYIGYFPLTITPEMVGSTVAVFLSVEAKATGKKITPGSKQENWLQRLSAAGAIAMQADSAEAFTRQVEEYIKRIRT